MIGNLMSRMDDLYGLLSYKAVETKPTPMPRVLTDSRRPDVLLPTVTPPMEGDQKAC